MGGVSLRVNRHDAAFPLGDTRLHTSRLQGPPTRVSLRVKLSGMRRNPTPEQIRDHVQAERQARRWSARRAAVESQVVSNTTWCRFEASARLTEPMRVAVATAFGWPDSWNRELPKLSSTAGLQQPDLTTRRLTDLEQQVRVLSSLVEWLLDRERARGEEPPVSAHVS